MKGGLQKDKASTWDVEPAETAPVGTVDLNSQNRALQKEIKRLKKIEVKLTQARDSAIAEKKRLEAILETAPAGIVIVEGEKGKIPYANLRALELYGAEPPTDLRLPFYSEGISFYRPDGTIYLPEELPLRRALRRGETVRGEEVVIRHVDGREITITVNASPLIIGSKLVGAVAGFMDITRLKKSEEVVKSLNKVLAKKVALIEDANRELEAFAYSLAHDLRAPLVVIDGYCRRLRRLFSEKLDEKGKEYVATVEEASGEALDRVQNLLGLFKIASGDPQKETVDLSEMTRTIAERFRVIYPDRDVEFLIQDGVVAQGNMTLLGIVMENLFNNALKFSSLPGRKPVIEFSAALEEEDQVFTVRDNGCGFDSSKKTKLFLPFGRLHSEQEFKGTGIGLATVKRIVHRLGGRVWAEGEEGRGAAFHFTLPRSE